MSVAVSTEMPMSAARKAGASLIPSPMNPTTCPLPRRARMTRCLWAGERRAKSVVFSAASASSASDIFSTSPPSSMGSAARPTSLQTFRLMSWLSPVRIFTADAVVVKGLEGASGGFLGRVQKRDVSFEHEIALVVLGADLLPGSSLVATARTRKPSLLRLVVLFLQPDHQVGVHGRQLPVQLEVRALVEDLFRSAFGEQNRFAFRDPPPSTDIMRRVKSNGISSSFLYFSTISLPVEVGAIQNRPVEQVLEAGLEVADQVAVQQHLLGFLSRHVAMPLKDDAILGERAGFVGAQNVHAAEVLNGVQPLDDHLLAAHGERALGEADRDDHGQHLRREAHGHGHREEKGALPIVLGEPVDEEDQRHHHGHELDHEPGEAVEALIEAGGRRLCRDRAGHAAEIGVDPGGDHDCGRRAAFDAGPHEADVLELGG